MLSFHSNYNSRNFNYTARKLWKTRFRSQDQENDIHVFMYVIRESVKGFLYYAYVHIPAIKVSILSTKK